MRHQVVVDVRGKGLLLGVKLVKDCTSKEPVGPQAISVVGGRPAAQPEGRLRFRPSRCKALILRTSCMPPLGTTFLKCTPATILGPRPRRFLRSSWGPFFHRSVAPSVDIQLKTIVRGVAGPEGQVTEHVEM
jgi:hypothetical protein